MDSTLTEIEKLFLDARTTNEFEFVQTLINNYGMAENQTNTNLFEWFNAIEQYKILYSQLSSVEKARIGLLLYSTFFESSDLYRILGNLSYNKLNLRGSPILYWKTKKGDRLLGTGEKVSNLTILFEECKLNLLTKFFDETHFQELRNTFFHSAYTFYNEVYFLLDSDPITVNNSRVNQIDINTFLFPAIDRVIQFFDKLKEQYYYHFNSYTEDKNIYGNFPDKKEVIILGSENGLKGFVVKNTAQFYGEWVDSIVSFDTTYKFWFTKNIELNYPRIEDIITDERLTRYEKIDDVRITDEDFNSLTDLIIERGRKNEMERLISLLIKFGDKKYSTMENESNPFKKKGFVKIILHFYQRVISINRHLNLKYITERISQLEKL
ncbi:MAG: hypothetical protein JNK27_11415 [Chitinophagaceae bacterium]|nr:hypothetical protein [Chitinophagaceae bacterium]